jgi:hypothetical protein
MTTTVTVQMAVTSQVHTFLLLILHELMRLARDECVSTQYFLLHERRTYWRKYPKFACE